MALQSINLGATGSGAGGDTARTAFEKLNANFSNPAHAASKLAQTSPADTTPGALMAVGAFGLGVQGPELSAADTFMAPGEYSGSTSMTGLPSGVSPARAVQKFIGSSTYGFQLVINANDADSNAPNLMWVRNWRGGVPVGGFKRLVHSHNILGTVSQSGGVPTGAIIERGSNANGEYIRWADGTQWCRVSKAYDWGTRLQRGNIWMTNETSIVLPASFVGNYEIFPSTPSSSVWWCGSVPTSQGSITVRAMSGSAETVTSFVRLDALCVGRWS